MSVPGRSVSFHLILLVALLLPLASAQICGVKGTVKNPYYNADNTTTDYKTCERFCMLQNGPSNPGGGCKTFSYSLKTRICSIYGLGLGSMQFKRDDKANAAFYQAACIPTTSKCDRENTASLVENGGFEFGNSSIGPWLTVRGRSSVGHPGFNSQNALLCPGNCWITNYRGDYCLGALYELTMDYKFVRVKPGGIPNVGPRLSVLFGDFGAGFRDAEDNLQEGKWQTFRATGQINPFDTSSPAIYFDSNKGLWHLYIDNVRIKPTEQSQNLGDNLLKNGGFEVIKSGEAKPWRYLQTSGTGNITISSPGLSEGSRKFEYSGTADSSGGQSFPSAGFELAQFSIPTTIGKSYQVSIDFKSVDLPVNKTTRYSVTFGPGSWSSNGGQKQTSEELQTTKHLKREIIAKVDSSVLTIDFFSVGINGVKSQHTVLDNIQIREVL